MGERFKTARAGNKGAFITALLTVKGFDYRGVVPQVMRYPRKPLRNSEAMQEAADDERGAEGEPQQSDQAVVA